MELKFYVYGGGDSSVGIGNLNAEITLKDNNIKYDKDDIEFIRQQIANIYESDNITIKDITTEKENLQEQLYWNKEHNDYLKTEKPKNYKKELAKNKTKEKEILKLIKVENEKYE